MHCARAWRGVRRSGHCGLRSPDTSRRTASRRRMARTTKMYHPMPSPSDTRWKRALDSVLRFTRMEKSGPPDDAGEVEFLRQLCRSLVQDLPTEPRCAPDLRILRARDRSGLWNLRSHLFGAVSLQHGEHVARERLQRLDSHWR